MATFQTYGQLKTQSFSWINRDDLDGNVPGFIALIEADLKRRIHILDLKMEDNAFDVDGETVTLPVPCRDIINFYHNTDGALIRRVAVDEAAIDGNHLGKPREYYVLDATSLRVAPPPDQIYSTTIYYNAEFTPLETMQTQIQSC